MKAAYIINAIGLLFDISGAILLALFGLPKDIRRSGQRYITLESVDTNEIEKAKLYDKLSLFAITLLVFGFIMQFLSCMIGIFNRP